MTEQMLCSMAVEARIPVDIVTNNDGETNTAVENIVENIQTE